MNKNIITIATGKQLYLNLAINLFRSFTWFHKDSDILFYIVTDNSQGLSSIAGHKSLKIIEIKKGELGEGFSTKLHLDKLAPSGKTLFIDSDCLIFGDLNPVFDRFRYHDVSVIGTYIRDREWFGDIKSICEAFEVPHIIKFNGGVYYLEKGPAASAVYETARKLEKDYDQIGFKRLRNKPNDEVIMGLAMQLHGQAPIEEDGSIMGEFVNFQSGFKGDVIQGKAELYNSPGHEKYQPEWPLEIGRPLIVHFLGDHTNIHPYTTFKKQLEYLSKGHSISFAKTASFITTSLPWLTKFYAKEILRPLYRKVAGVRKIKKSERIID